MEAEINSIFTLFFEGNPIKAQIIDTSRGEGDFRTVLIIETDSMNRCVIKLAENDFTSPDRIAVWERTANEYRRLGCWCPRIFRDKTGGFPTIEYRGHNCVAYAEEFSPYRPAVDRAEAEDNGGEALYESYKLDVWSITARIAAQHFDYSPFPSAYCLFETFCPSDKTDEVLENALAWKECADKLPEEFSEQTDRIWQLWIENRAALEKVYNKLPSSVFQADLNPTNILLDDDGGFVGLYDFNLCGREVFLNYLMRENYEGFSREIAMIRDALRISSAYYRFSEIEKETATMLYRCLKPLWYSRVENLKELGNDREAIAAFLDETEYYLTSEIDFTDCMG